MLSFIDPGCGYETWIRIGMALHDAGFPVEIWDTWSRGSDKYDDTDNHWHSFGKRSGGAVATIGTLIYHAQ